MRTLRKHLIGFWVLLVCACDGLDPIVPYPMHMDLEVVGDGQLFGLASQPLETPVTVRLVHAGTRAPVAGLRLTWQAQGDAVIESVNATTDVAGLSQARVRFGSAGKSVLQVSLEGMPAISTSIELHTTDRPVISGFSVRQATAGETIVVLGAFPQHDNADYQVVFDGVNAQVLSATSEHLRVIVPGCLGNRTVQVQALFKGVPGTAARLNVTEAETAGTSLRPGEVLEMRGRTEPSCIRLRERGTYLVVAQNARAVAAPGLDFTLTTFAGNGGAVTAARASSVPVAAGSDWEMELRRREAQALRGAWRTTPRVSARATSDRVTVGSRRAFQVPTLTFSSTIVQARVRVLSEHAIIYEDLLSPAQLTDADLAGLASLFDRVIQPTDREIFGPTPDVDDNQRVIILLTPAVNRLTPGDGSSGFLAGFVSGCDLIESLLCTAHNGADMLYAVVPDSAGTFGIPHSKERILDLLPGVLAHELVHLIHFNQRTLLGGVPTLEDTWLSEGLAHAAEELVADRLARAGDEAGATRMRRENYKRAARFLRDPAATGLADDSGDSLAGRGAAWLFVKYLSVQFGSAVLADLLKSVTQGAETVTSATGAHWSDLLSDWSIAVFTATEPGSELPRDARHRLGGFDLRAAVRSVTNGDDPVLSPLHLNGTLTGTLPSSAVQFTTLQVSEPANVVFAGLRGRGFDVSTAAQVAVLRVR